MAKVTNPNRWTAESIYARMEQSDAWLYRSILAIYGNQTSDEQAAGLTKEQNGIGFNALDAKLLSAIASHLKTKGWISVRQKQDALKAMRKYTKQLAKIANAKL